MHAVDNFSVERKVHYPLPKQLHHERTTVPSLSSWQCVCMCVCGERLPVPVLGCVNLESVYFSACWRYQVLNTTELMAQRNLPPPSFVHICRYTRPARSTSCNFFSNKLFLIELLFLLHFFSLSLVSRLANIIIRLDIHETSGPHRGDEPEAATPSATLEPSITSLFHSHHLFRGKM